MVCRSRRSLWPADPCMCLQTKILGPNFFESHTQLRAHSSSTHDTTVNMSDAPLIKSTERLPTTPGRGSNHLNEGGKNSRVAIIGYLPDLHPLYRRENTSFSEPAATEADVSSPYTFSPSTPLISAFRAADPRKALSSWFREGSVRGSVFNLCSATLGAGALSLPYAFSKAGWVLGLIMLTLGGAATIFSIHLLFRARKATNCVSYEDLTVNIFGKCMGFIVELNILIFCFGTAVAYIIAVGDILEPVLIMTGVDRWILGLNATSNNHNNSSFFLTTATATTPSSALSPSSSSSFGDLTEAQEHTLRVVSMVTFFICIMFPLSLLEKINSLRFTSFFGVAAIFYLVFTTVYQSIETMVQQGGWFLEWGSFMGRCNVTDFTMCGLFRCFASFCKLVFVLFVDCSKGWSFNTWAGTEFNTDLFSIVQAAPIIMFAFTCQVNVFSIYDELEKPVSICRHHLSNCLVVQGNRVERGGGGYKYNFSRVLICNFFFFSRQHCNSRTAKCQK